MRIQIARPGTQCSYCRCIAFGGERWVWTGRRIACEGCRPDRDFEEAATPSA